jgi:(p)ppGpp synthase/HD superfamily hydrolase
MVEKVHYEKLTHYFTNKELEIVKRMPDNYVKALELVYRIYNEDLDKSGKTQIGHFGRVSDSLETEDEKITGLLHDIVEDGYLTLNDLLAVGIPPHIVAAISILTRDKTIHREYKDYVTSILKSNNELAIRVKYADMLDNSSPERLDLLEEKTKKRLENKYKKQLPRLEKYLKNQDVNCLVRKRNIK